ncbi:periplasmic binding protein [Denitrovibrio acetiphilus DSM 12809]|uniref:Periplasmic binding protein n=1 Tax=Denitrovibrio acetiphilus (strain DSM 12809 / NBRC 114555 / N2460) TaxID=522772 RepID=D4H835_DENA2|nr:ABC transporter substrate-binding protein [Denitrovibrio acetiphilus]ADD68184.1 periplasmic binding protein [Denitrovibrio acetiphilus DSM 12809]
MKKFLFILLFITSSITFANEVTVEDMAGRSVQTPEKVTKLVAIGPGALRMVVYAGAQDMIVGRELMDGMEQMSFKPYMLSLPDSYKDLPVISSGGSDNMPDIEQIVALAPDVIFASSFSIKQMDEIQNKTNIPVVSITYGSTGHTDIRTVKNCLRLVGYLTQTQQRAQEIVNYMAILRKDLLQRTEGVSDKKVYMASVAYHIARGFNSSDTKHPACCLVGGSNVAGILSERSKGTHTMLQMESILKQQPDYIFYDVTGLEVLKDDYKYISTLLKLFDAVKKERIYVVPPYNWYNSNVENIFVTAYFMGKVMYPEKFADVNIYNIANEIYNVFLQNDSYRTLTESYPVYKKIIFHEDSFSIKN